ncbi:RNA helicase, partial [Streptomyces sp. NPDC048479]
GITPHTTHVRSGEAELNRITGAQPPSGIPITITAPVTERPKRGGAPFRGRGTRPGRPGRAGSESRRSAEARQTAEARKAARVRRAA